MSCVITVVLYPAFGEDVEILANLGGPSLNSVSEENKKRGSDLVRAIQGASVASLEAASVANEIKETWMQDLKIR